MPKGSACPFPTYYAGPVRGEPGAVRDRNATHASQCSMPASRLLPPRRSTRRPRAKREGTCLNSRQSGRPKATQTPATAPKKENAQAEVIVEADRWVADGNQPRDLHPGRDVRGARGIGEFHLAAQSDHPGCE